MHEATAIHHGLGRRADLQSRLSGHQIWTDTAKETLPGGRELVSPKKPTRAGTPGSRPPSVVPWQRREDEPTSARCDGQLSRFASASLCIASLCRAFLPLYLGPLWASEIARRAPTSMGLEAPGPQSNPPTRDFLYRQEVVYTMVDCM